MTAKEIEIVKKSWRKLQGINPELLGDVFYTKLFLLNPSLERMFKTPKEIQSKKLIDMFHSIVLNLENLDGLSDEIEKMGNSHKGYGAKPKHYDSVGNALIWTLANALQKDWNDDVEKAWITCYTILAEKMQKKLD